MNSLPTVIVACGEIDFLLPAPVDTGEGSLLGCTLDALWPPVPETIIIVN